MSLKNWIFSFLYISVGALQRGKNNPILESKIFNRELALERVGRILQDVRGLCNYFNIRFAAIVMIE